MSCDFLSEPELGGGLLKDSDGMIEMERKALMVDSTGVDHFRQGVMQTRPGKSQVQETLNAWSSFESFA